MMLASVLKPILLLLRYPRLHKAVSGPHETIGAHILRIPDSTACQVFYPASSESSSKSSSTHTPYFREEALEGIADFMNSSKTKSLLRYLNSRRHPCHVDATPKLSKITSLDSSGPSSPSSFPVVIFSHGLGGCLEMYTQLCRNVASHGFIVFAMEHEDGSASFAQTNEGERIYYTKPDDTPYSREKVLNFRGPMYERRVGEITRLVEYLYSAERVTTRGDVGEFDDSSTGNINEAKGLLDTDIDTSTMDQILAKLMTVSDLSNGVSLLGHSFGGTTMALVQQRLQSTTTPTSTTTTTPIINSVAVLDPWCFSLPDTSLTSGVSAPLLSILSANWDKGREYTQVQSLLHNSNTQSPSSSVLQSPRGVHQSFSDTYCWLPGFVGKRMGMRGREEGLHETCWASGEVCGAFFRREMRHTSRGGGDEDERVEEEEDGVSTSARDALLPFSIS